jgi:predicted methyltransferase
MKQSLLALSAALLCLAACQHDSKPTMGGDNKADTMAAKTTSIAWDNVLNGDWRSAENKARDKYRHPKETLEFFGLKPGMTVVEITPGGGWYTEVLAPALQGNGKLYAAVYDPTAMPEGRGRDYQTKNNETLRAKLAANPNTMGGAELLPFDPANPQFGEGRADLVVTFRNVHNWTSAGNDAAMFKGFFAALKPGGVLGVEEHRAAAGTDAKTSAETGYIPTEYVVKLATDAGFELAEKSEINANPNDTKDYEGGVWTLPPTYGLGDKDKAKYAAIGESDRMTLRFIKPSK